MARSFLFMPPGLEKFITKDIVYKMKDDRIVTEMSKGEHIRDGGVTCTKQIEFSFVFTSQAYDTWRQFFRVARGRTFWMPFPNPNDTQINPQKCYCFGFSKVDEFQDKQGIKFVIPVKLSWHYMVPGRDYGDQSL